MKILIIILSSLFVASAFAATNPTAPASESSGTANVSVEVGALVQISQVRDINITSWNGGAYSEDPQLTQQFCVFSNASNPLVNGYTIQFSDSNQTFLLKNAATNDTASYEINYNNQQVTGPTTLTNQVGSPSMSCGGVPNATLKVNIVGAASNLLRAGDYTDTLSMMVSPQT